MLLATQPPARANPTTSKTLNVIAAARARRNPLGPCDAGAYAVSHAGSDRDAGSERNAGGNRRHARSDAMAYFIGSEIYSQLEKVVDRFEDVADEISGIVIENV